MVYIPHYGGIELYTQGKAYLMWALSLFIPGMHRFYLGKIGSGIVYFLTGGLFFIGTLTDLFRIPRLVQEANYEHALENALMQEAGRLPERPIVRKKESIERVILKTAKNNNGVITPSEVALEGDIPIEEARKYLEKIAAKGFAEMKITTNGVIVYRFPEFLKETKEAGYEI
jgi:TM2 domain-containing membrane protein YozV